MERIQVFHGRTIRIASVFPENGRCSLKEELKAPIDLETQQQKLYVQSRCCLGKALDTRAILEYSYVTMLWTV